MTTAITYILKHIRGFLYLPLLFGFLLPAPEVIAQDVIWTGDIDSDWHKPGNWSSTQVPGPESTVNIRPQDGNPYPVISEEVTIAHLVVSQWHGGGDLTVSDNGRLTVTDELTINDDGRLIVDPEGTVEIIADTLAMNTGSFIEVLSGTFISHTNATLNGSFTADEATLLFKEDLFVSNDQHFTVGTSIVTVDGEATINGMYNGDEGTSIFNRKVSVNSGGEVNLTQGELYFNNEAFIGNNGTINLGSGTAEFQGSVSVESSGHFNIDDATVNITGDADFTSGGYLNVNNGSINVLGNASLSSGGAFTFVQGSLNVGGDASFTSGGDMYAGNAQIDFQGDLTVPYGSDFNAQTSTVTFSGNGEQIIHTGGDDLTFYNVKVASASSLQTDGETENTIIITNNLDVDEGGHVGIKDDDTIDIQGTLNDEGSVESIKPFVYSISTPSLNEVVVIFDKAMDPGSVQRVSNYSINQNISVSNATLSPADPTRLTLEVSTLADNQEYELTINEVYSSEGGEISQNHIKRFRTLVDITYYSRRSGSWNDPSSWSVQGHNGTAASDLPNTKDGEDAIIGSNHTITIESIQAISNLNELLISSSGTLQVSSGGTLFLNNFVIVGGGTFELQKGATLGIGSPRGIAEEGSAEGNIQTAYRSFSSGGSYIYNGSQNQHTGSGLPQKVHDLQITNASDVEASNDLEVEGTLFLEEGSLIIPSGKGLIANTKSVEDGSLTFQRALNGNSGWRMISSPVTASYETFLNGILTQGFAGSDHESLQPNIMYYDETYEGTDNQRWRAPSSSASEVPAGLGYNLYLFGDIPEDDRYNDPLPQMLTVQGQEHTSPNGQIDFNITYTAEADTGWNLVGNPYGASIDWDDTASWEKTNIDETIYVWDPNSHSYKTWNGITGSLDSGIIPPFQAFWIKASAENPELQVREEAKTFGGEFVGKRIADNHPEIEVTIEDKGQSSSIFFSFTKDAKVGKDPRDAYYLQPPPDTQRFIELYTVGRKSNPLTINSLPLKFGTPIEIPISANIVENSHKISASVNLHLSKVKNIPYSWNISLIDRKTGQEVTTSEEVQYSFKTTAEPSFAGDTTHVLKKEYHILAQASPEEARFALLIDPGALGLGLPTEINLKQNYPNPFSSQTTIRFALPIQNEVTLEVYDVLGRKVAVILDNESYQAGLHQVEWAAADLASGTYIYRLKTQEKTITKKLTVIK